MTEKQYNKLIDSIVKEATRAGWKEITREEVINRYNDYLKQRGAEKAESALKYTLKQFKKIANKMEKKFWQSVKNEVFNKIHCCPCSLNELKRMIRAGEIDITGYTKEHEIKQKLNII